MLIKYHDLIPYLEPEKYNEVSEDNKVYLYVNKINNFIGHIDNLSEILQPYIHSETVTLILSEDVYHVRFVFSEEEYNYLKDNYKEFADLLGEVEDNFQVGDNTIVETPELHKLYLIALDIEPEYVKKYPECFYTK